MDENKEILQLLKQIEKASRRQTLCSVALCIFALVTAACCIVTFLTVGQILPQIAEVVPQVTGVISQMQTVLGNLEQTTAQLASMDLGSMVSNVDTLVATGQESLEQTMAKLNSIDISTLNGAIKDLAAVVEPLAKVSSLFK